MTIASLFSPDLKIFLQKIEELGFVMCLVGGAPRDYLREKRLSLDLDFEMRRSDISLLISFLKKNKINFEILPYQIIRVDFNGVDLEFSVPRIETAISGNKSHHHFEASLDKNYSYLESFKRRDFTINAIGIEMDFKNQQEKIIDPYEGVSDLKKGILRKISDDFFLDSVRFLRMIRFSIKYQLSIDTSIENRLNEFDLSELSIHHFIEELGKSLNPALFINRFNELVSRHHLVLPMSFKFWSELQFSSKVENRDDLLVETFLQKKQLAKDLSTFFSMPDKRVRDLESFYNSLEVLKSASEKNFLFLVKTPLDSLTDIELLKDMKNLEEKKEWRKYFSEKLLISWEDWQSQQVDPQEIEKTPAPLRSYVRFYKTIQRVLGND